MKLSRFYKTTAMLSVAGLALVACGDSNDDAGTDENGAGGDGGSVTIGVFNGWDEGIAVSELWKYILEEEGYDVELTYADPAPAFSGVASGDYDFVMDGWLPITHEDYVNEYGDDLEDLGVWNDEAALTIAVNEDAPIDSLDELADHADEFNNTIVGIEPGAGLTRVTTDEAIPTYGLEDMEYTTSSTPAMLQELNTAIEDGENIVVTLWRPHWAYDEFPIRDLEDPEEAMGAAESIHTFANPDFVADNEEVADWLRNFEMDGDTLHSLENVMFNENPDTDDYQPIVEEWVADNQEYVDGLTQ